jgi:uncharacterized protein YjiS (DUF1127 family)
MIFDDIFSPTELRTWWPHVPYRGALVRRVAGWRQRARSLRLLARLDDRMLRDIGLDRDAADSDSVTSFWRLR